MVVTGFIARLQGVQLPREHVNGILYYAAVVQLVERHPSKVDVASPSPVCRSILKDAHSNQNQSRKLIVMRLVSQTVSRKGGQ